MTSLRNLKSNLKTSAVLLRACSCSNTTPMQRYSVLSNEKRNCFNERKHIYCIQTNRLFSKAEFGAYLTTDFAPVGVCAKLLEYVHDLTGLPWWASIGLTAYTLRTMMLPLTFITIKNFQQRAKLQPEIIAKAVLLEQSMRHLNKKTAQRQFNKEMKKFEKKLYARENCHPFRIAAAPLAQMPLWICMSFALRNLAGFLPDFGQEIKLLRPDLANEGLWWFPDLLLRDHTCILPTILVSVGLILTKFSYSGAVKSSSSKNMLQTYKQHSPMVLDQKYGRYIQYYLLAVMFLAANVVPSCMSLYWVYSMSFGLITRLLLRTPSVRRLLGIETTQPQQKQ